MRTRRELTDTIDEITARRMERHDSKAYHRGTLQRSKDGIRMAQQIREQRERDERRIEREERRAEF